MVAARDSGTHAACPAERRWQGVNRCQGMTLIEVLISTLFVSFLLIGALTGLSAATRANQASSEIAFASQLGEEMVAEIMSNAFKDPDGGSWIGPDSAELSADRRTFDDVDDYNNWDQSPPLNRDGSARAAATGWRRQVTVSHVLRSFPDTVSILETGLKKVSVTVTSPSGKRFEWTVLRSHAGSNEAESTFDETLVRGVGVRIESRQSRHQRQSSTATVNHAHSN